MVSGSQARGQKGKRQGGRQNGEIVGGAAFTPYLVSERKLRGAKVFPNVSF